MLPSRPDPRPVMPRTASIDSAVSSLSSTSQSTRSTPAHAHNSSRESNSTPAADIAGLVAASGSAEAALHKLWREKQSADSHNAQLWRLVEKQRAMILGLNRDLERAVKDKDRYRQKMKDLSTHASGAVLQRPDSVLDREGSQSPAPADGAEESSKVSKSSSSQKHYPSVPTTISETLPEHLRGEVKAIQFNSPTSDSASPGESNGDLTSIESSPIVGTSVRAESAQELSETPAIQHENIEKVASISTPPKAGTRDQPPVVVALPPPKTPESHVFPQAGAPSLALTEATPIPDAGNFSPRNKQTARKPAPAPLNLSLPTRPPPAVPTIDNSPIESPIKTVVPLDSEALERGRRKTREDDDRMREAMAMAQEAARSLSKKSKGMSKSKTPKEQPQIIEPVSIVVAPSLQGLPPSPRLAQAPMPPSSLLSPSGSESSISSTAAHRSNLSTPLLSPGLPMSPRPGDRPFNAPSPRLPKQMIFPAPASPRIAYAPNPPSPRIAYAPNPPSPRSIAPVVPIAVEPTRAPAASSLKAQSSKPMGFSVLSPSAVPPPLFAKSDSQKSVPTLEQRSSSPVYEQPRLAMEQNTPSSGRPSTGSSDTMNSEVIFRGLISDQYPGLLLPPNALPFIDVKVSSSRLRPSRHSILLANPNEEDPVFLLGIYARADGKQLWRLEKTIMALPALHQQIKALCAFDGKLPEKGLFSGHAPAKIDARRMALNSYFDLLLDTPLTEKAALVVCNFFSTNVMGVEGEENHVLTGSPGGTASSITSNGPPRKDGYLTKRGKNFGGWKARFFVLDGPELRYYDSPGGPQIGTIKLLKAQIGKQSPQHTNQSPMGRDDEAEHQYRHAFLVLEPKRKDSSSLVRHVLCAESDEERDAWVTALLAYVDYQEEKTSAPPSVASSDSIRAAGPSQMSFQQQKEVREAPSRDPPRPPTRQIQTPEPAEDPSEIVQGMSYEQTVAGETPIRGTTISTYRNTPTSQPSQPSQNSRSIPSPLLNANGFVAGPAQAAKDRSFMISAPSNGVVIQDAGMWGNKTAAKEKKRSIFGFRGRSSSDTAMNQSNNPPLAPEQQRRHLGRPIFGMPLAEAVEASQPVGVDVYLPAVVYRCIEYLETRDAILEEGIFRLSGSQNVIKALRERFNNEIDVKLLDGDYYDPHAVASLLKLYLRELPASVLTRELHLDFLKVLDVEDKDKRVAAFNILVHKLPRANAELLSNLCSYLADIAHKADVNKMNVRNGTRDACILF
jgi:RalA-binding protein 1